MIVAVTGIILILFVIGHLLGNLQIFLGPDWINGYSEHLRDLGPLLWVIRLFLLAAVVVHIYVTIQLAIENRRARPQAYLEREYVKATFASRHMVMSGLIVLAFIIYHIAHFTVRVTDPRFGLLNDGVRIPKLLRLRVLRAWPFFARASSQPRIVELLSIPRI